MCTELSNDARIYTGYTPWMSWTPRRGTLRDGLFIYLDCFDYSNYLVIIAVQPITEITHNRPCEAIIFITPGMLLAGGAWCIAVNFKRI